MSLSQGRPRFLRGPKGPVTQTWRVGWTWPSGHGGKNLLGGAPWPQRAVNGGEQRGGLQCGVRRESWPRVGGRKLWGPSHSRARSD